MKKLIVSMATVGLTMCNSGGAVDPAPSPLVCRDGGNDEFGANGTVSGSMLTLRVNAQESWKGTPSLSNVVGATVVSIAILPNSNVGQVTIILDVSGGDAGDAGGPSTSGSFTLKGEITDGNVTCAVSHDFKWSISNGNVQIAALDDPLPLRRRDPASIEMMGRVDLPSGGGEVQLRATGAGPKDSVTWTATDGSLAQDEGTVRWTLPSEPGLYQIEVLVDRGSDGVALDTLVMEVT